MQSLAELAVTDNVDADLGLLAHNLSDGLGQASFERRLLIGLAVLDQVPELDQFRRPDQAADMSGEDAIDVVRHG